MRILVTGGAGFIGSHLVKTLLAEGHDVYVMDDLSTGFKYKVDPKAKFWIVDILTLAAIPAVDIIYHLAAKARVIPSFENPEEYFDNNVTGTFRLLEHARKHRVKKFIFASSSSVYGKTQPANGYLAESDSTSPMSPYGFSKLAGELLLRQYTECYGMETIAMRFFNVYGPGMAASQYKSVMQSFLEARASAVPLPVFGDGSHKRDYTYVSDVVDALAIAGLSDFSGTHQVFNVGSGSSHSVMDVAAQFGGLIENLPPVPNEPESTRASIFRSRQLLSWRPKISMQEGVKKLIDDYGNTKH